MNDTEKFRHFSVINDFLRRHKDYTPSNREEYEKFKEQLLSLNEPLRSMGKGHAVWDMNKKIKEIYKKIQKRFHAVERKKRSKGLVDITSPKVRAYLDEFNLVKKAANTPLPQTPSHMEIEQAEEEEEPVAVSCKNCFGRRRKTKKKGEKSYDEFYGGKRRRRKKKTRKKRGGLDSFPIGMLDQLSQDTVYNNPHKDDLIRRLNHIWNILGEDEEDQEAFKDLIRRNPNSFYQLIIHFIQQAEAEHHGGRRKKKKTRKRRKGGRKKTRKKRKRNKTRRKRRTKKAGFTSRSKLEEGIEGCNKLKESSKILDCRNIGGLKNYHQQQTKKSFFKKIHLPHRPHFHRETKTERHNREMRDMEWDFGSFGQN